MSFLNKLAKFLLISIIVFLAYLFNTDSAYAEGNNLAPGTLILTPKGNVPIETLHSGDRVVGYNFSTHQEEINTIKSTQLKSSLSYYLINHQTKISGTQLVYVNSPKIVRVSKLRDRDRLIGQNHFLYLVKQVEQIVQPSKIYQITLDNEESNFFVDNFLVYGGNKIPTIFKESYRDCPTVNAYSRQTVCLNELTLPGFLLAFGIIITIIFFSEFFINFYNFIRFYGKNVTDNSELLEFIHNINSKFTNRYSTKYRKSSKVWQSIDLRENINELEYEHLIGNADLIKQVNHLFYQYQNDLTNKDYDRIAEYFPDFFKEKQYLTQNINIIYQPKIIDIAIIDFKQSEDKSIFRVQINGEMTNFTISEQGYLLSGDSELKMFSEYWDIELNADNRCCIKEISLPLRIRILQLDIEAKRKMFRFHGYQT